ncbi:MAG: serine protease [Candidatus Acidiferrum sp.]
MKPPMRFKSICVVVGAFLLLSSVSYAGPLPVVFLDRVVAIGRKDTTPGPNLGKWIGEASGFLYGEFDHKVGNQSSYVIYLVTNHHVIDEHIAATNGPLSVRLNRKSSGTVQEYDFPLVVDGLPTWHAHPDPVIDIAVVRLNGPWLEQMGIKFDYFHSDFDTLNRVKAKELGLSEGYGVFVLGFPMNLVGTQQDYVVVRQGSIARVRDALDAPATVKSFLIDSFIFPGNSGSPVVLRPETFEAQFPGEKPPIRSAFLLGVVSGYLPYTDIAISLQTKHPRVTFEENSGLTEVFPADCIDETIQDWNPAPSATHSAAPNGH